MSKYKYSVKNLNDNQARALARDASVSFKSAIEACNFLRGRNTKQAISLLEKVLDKKIAIPFKRFTNGVGHRKGKGIGAGRYPQKLSDALIKLIKNAEANASIKGLNENLKIVHMSAQKASVPMHYGRHPRREMKRAHIELIVEEVEEKKSVTKKKPKVKSQKSTKKEEVKQEKQSVKKEVKKESKEEIKKEKQETKKEEVKQEKEMPKPIKKEDKVNDKKGNTNNNQDTNKKEDKKEDAQK